MRVVLGIASLCALTFAVAGCQSAGPSEPHPSATAPADHGDLAAWEVLDDSLSAESTAVRVGVTRLGCAGGETGETLDPIVTYEATRIVIQIDVERLPDGAHSCPDNNVVPVTIMLDEPVGERALVDSSCFDEQIASTAFCADSAGVRWP